MADEDRLRAVERATDLIPTMLKELALEMRGAMREQTKETAGLKEQIATSNGHIKTLTEQGREHEDVHEKERQQRDLKAATLRGRADAQADLWHSMGVTWKLLIGVSPIASAVLAAFLGRVV